MALLVCCLKARDVARPFKLGRRARSGIPPRLGDPSVARGSLRLRRRDPLAGRDPLARFAALVWRDEQNPLPFGKVEAMSHYYMAELILL